MLGFQGFRASGRQGFRVSGFEGLGCSGHIVNPTSLSVSLKASAHRTLDPKPLNPVCFPILAHLRFPRAWGVQGLGFRATRAS